MQTIVKADRSEHFLYNSADFPVLAQKGNITSFKGCSALAHWHDDLEFALLLSGTMDYNINGETISVSAGDGIFINTRQLHYNFSSNRTECEYLCVLLHPTLLCANPYVERTFVTPLLQDGALPYRTLQRENSWEGRVLQEIREIYDHRNDKTAALKMQESFFRIWTELFENTPLPDLPPKACSQSLTALKHMVNFLQQHYREKIALADIARAGNVSKTTCCHIFEKYCNQSPVAYLVEYRLRSGIELLRTSDMTVTEVCYEVGFSGASYFSESFKRAFGCSPTEFRKRDETVEQIK